MMVTSLSLTAEFINNDTDSSAFIYGLMSFTDKLLNGVGVFLIQHLTPDTGSSLSEELILASINPKCKERFLIELRVQYKKTTSSLHVV